MKNRFWVKTLNIILAAAMLLGNAPASWALRTTSVARSDLIEGPEDPNAWRKKIVYIILDGVSDGENGIAEFGGKTPLEQANLPNLDKLVKQGIMGQMDTVGEGIAPQSDQAVLSILSYGEEDYPGRGLIETLGADVEVPEGGIALRVNFATGHKETENLIIEDRRAGRIKEQGEITQLAQEVNSKVKLTAHPDATFKFIPTVEHRGILIIHVPRINLNPYVTNSDPAYSRKGLTSSALEEGSFEYKVQRVIPQDKFKNDKNAQLLADLINEFSQKTYDVLNTADVNRRRQEQGQLPANLIVARDACSRSSEFKTLSEKTGGMKWAMFAEVPAEFGIGKLIGMDIIHIPVSQGNWEQEYRDIATKVEETLKRYDGLYVHIKGPDLPGHDGDAQRKVNITEAIDKHFLGPLLQSNALKDAVLVVTADHTTSALKRGHTADPVPVLIVDSVTPDATINFTEKSAGQGSLGRIKGTELLDKLISIAKVRTMHGGGEPEDKDVRGSTGGALTREEHLAVNFEIGRVIEEIKARGEDIDEVADNFNISRYRDVLLEKELGVRRVYFLPIRVPHYGIRDDAVYLPDVFTVNSNMYDRSQVVAVGRHEADELIRLIYEYMKVWGGMDGELRKFAQIKRDGVDVAEPSFDELVAWYKDIKKKIEFKKLAAFREVVVNWLEEFDDRQMVEETLLRIHDQASPIDRDVARIFTDKTEELLKEHKQRMGSVLLSLHHNYRTYAQENDFSRPVRGAAERIQSVPRRPMVIGDLKNMVGTREETIALLEEFASLVKETRGVDIGFAPPLVFLRAASNTLKDLESRGIPEGKIKIISQNMHVEDKPATVDGVTALQLKDAGVKYVLLGHPSIGEDDIVVNQKIKTALRHNLMPIVCIGRNFTEDERKDIKGAVEQMTKARLNLNLKRDITVEQAKQIVLAYAPEGFKPAPEEAEDIISFIRGLLVDMFGEEIAAEIRILNAGGVNPDNIESVIAQPNTDGALVGSAALKAESLAAINQSAANWWAKQPSVENLVLKREGIRDEIFKGNYTVSHIAAHFKAQLNRYVDYREWLLKNPRNKTIIITSDVILNSVDVTDTIDIIEKFGEEFQRFKFKVLASDSKQREFLAGIGMNKSNIITEAEFKEMHFFNYKYIRVLTTNDFVGENNGMVKFLQDKHIWYTAFERGTPAVLMIPAVLENVIQIEAKPDLYRSGRPFLLMSGTALEPLVSAGILENDNYPSIIKLDANNYSLSVGNLNLTSDYQERVGRYVKQLHDYEMTTRETATQE